MTKQHPNGSEKGRKCVWHCTIRERRRALNLTIRDIANDVGLTTSAISVIERGSDPQLSTASKLAAFFGVSIQDLWPQRYHDPKPRLCDVREDLIVRGQVHDDSKLARWFASSPNQLRGEPPCPHPLW